jgi:hypothetical protein
LQRLAYGGRTHHGPDAIVRKIVFVFDRIVSRGENNQPVAAQLAGAAQEKPHAFGRERMRPFQIIARMSPRA